MLRVLATLSVLGCLGCHRESATLGPEDEMVQTMVEVSEIFAADGADCARLARDLQAYSDAHVAVLGRVRELAVNATPAEQQAITARHRATIEAAVAKMRACPGDPAVDAAMHRMPH
jgi:hypothetical protein